MSSDRNDPTRTDHDHDHDRDRDHDRDCMVCGAELSYLGAAREVACAYCGQVEATEVTCAGGHFVCDACHGRDTLAVLAHLCDAASETV